jgi:hypothetical protein
MCDVIVVRFTLFTRRSINGSGKTSHQLKIKNWMCTKYDLAFSILGGVDFFANSYSVGKSVFRIQMH